MQLVENYQMLSGLIAAVRNLRCGFVTNFYPDQIKHELWIRKKILYYEQVGDVLFFIKQNDDFGNLFYCSPNVDMLQKALFSWQTSGGKRNLIVDIIGTDKQCLAIRDVFYRSRFEDYGALMRMCKTSPAEFCNISDLPVRLATPEEGDEICFLLQEYFDPQAEQIPFPEEILKLIEEKRILIYPDREKIAGFLIYELTKSTLYLRYWFVHPAYREKGIGSALMQRFFYEGRDTKRQLFWVLCSNENAIKRYKHYGFQPENMYDYVLIWK